MDTTTTVEQAVHAALAGVDDPEIHKPITELGMVKGVTVVADGIAHVGGLPHRGGLPDARDDHQRGSPRPCEQVPGDPRRCGSSWT